MKEYGACKYEIGAILRPEFRRICSRLDLAVEEQRGVLSSEYNVRGDLHAIALLNEWISKIS